MTLAPGTKLGPYEILSPIGAGGMGEVYQVHDPLSFKHLHAVRRRLQLPPKELVEGPRLADRIKPGAISLEESLEIARQIADALEAAHEKGIVHRDLKPGNSKLRPGSSS